MFEKPRLALLRLPLILGLACAFVSVGAFAQEAIADEDDIFGAEETVGETSENTNALRDTLFSTEGVVLGGSFSGSAGLTGTWNDPWGGAFDLFSADKAELSPATSLSLGFSAKPERDLSFYGELRSAYPFTRSAAVLDEAGENIGATTVPDITIFKLYSKFDWADRVFFSFGKQALKWGKGYFFTPANDILALSAVNFDDPEAEREGPLSLRVNAPIPGTMASAYLFAIMDATSIHPTKIAVAPKFEFSLPSLEFSLSGFYRYEDPVKAIASASYASNGWSFFGEGVLAYGSDKYFVVKEERIVDIPAIPPFIPASQKTFYYRIVEKPESIFLTGTAGALYSNSWENKLSLTVVGQYLYDGEGQANMSLDDMLQAVIERMHPAYDYADDPAVSIADPAEMASALGKFGSRLGRHYAAVSVNAAEILGSDVSASVFALANLADLSGWVKPQISYKIFDRMSVSGWANFSFGEGGGEFTNLGGIYKAVQGISVGPGGVSYEEANLTPTMQLGLSFTLGNGSF